MSSAIKVNNTKILKQYDGKMKNSRWSKFSWHVINIIIKTRYKLLSFFINVENNKEFEPEDIGTHNRKMVSDNWYVFGFYFKCTMYIIRFRLINFFVDVIVTIFVLIIFVIVATVTGFITFIAMMILIF